MKTACFLCFLVIFDFQNIFGLTAPILITEPTGLFVDSGHKIELRKPLEDRFLKVYLYGHYVGVSSLWDGYSIHLFPNMRFVISHHMELRKDKIVSYGVWGYSDGIISFEHEYLDLSDGEIVTNGKLNKFYFFLKSNEDTIEDSVLISENTFSKLVNNDGLYDYFKREIAYYDWEKVFKEKYPKSKKIKEYEKQEASQSRGQ